MQSSPQTRVDGIDQDTSAVSVRGWGMSGKQGEVFADLDLDVPVGAIAVIRGTAGSGKTSLLRAGLVPYLDASGAKNAYASGETASVRVVLDAIAPGAGSLFAALEARCSAGGRRLALVLDQVEPLVATADGRDFLAALLDGARPDEALARGVASGSHAVGGVGGTGRLADRDTVRTAAARLLDLTTRTVVGSPA